MTYESITQNLITGDSTPLYFGLMVALVLIVFVFSVLVMANYKKRADLYLWYKTVVTGYKVGILEKAAKDEDVTIVEPKKLSVAEVAREELMKDLEH